MLRSAITLTMLGALLVAGTAGAAEVYKYTDDKGNVYYTDKPRELDTQRLNVQTAKANPSAPPAAAPGAELKRMQDADAARKQASTQKANEAEAAQSNAKDRAERCKKARDRYDTYITSRKLFEEKPGGERRYLTSEELDTARADAKTSMDLWCK